MQVLEEPAGAPGHGWDEYVLRHADGTPFHRIQWRDLVARHFRHRPRYLAARKGGRLVGVLPLFETRSMLSGKALVSVPYAVYGGPLADSDEVADALLAAAEQILRREGHRFAELRTLRSHRDDLADTGLYVTFRRTLPENPEECLDMIPRKSRATTRQARDRHRLQLVEGRRWLVGFHDLFVRNKGRLGSPCFPRRFFERVLDSYGHAARLHGVVQDGRLLVAAISLVQTGVFNPYWSGSVPGADRLGASNFLYWRLMQRAVLEGCHTFDFGRSRVDTGPFHFKRHMGFEPTGLQYRYLLAPGAEVPRVNPSNPVFRLPKLVLQRLPSPLLKLVGPRLMAMVP